MTSPTSTPHLLFGTDFSEAAFAAIPAVARLTRGLGAALTIAHVDAIEAEPVYAPTDELRGYQEHLRRLRDDSLREIRYAFRENGLDAVDFAMLDAPSGSTPASQLIEASLARSAELLIVAKQGVRLTDRWLLGSTSQRLARHAPLPVLVLPRRADPDAKPAPIQRILMPTDFSEPSATALDYISSLASRLWTHAPSPALSLLHISHPPLLAAGPMASDVSPPASYTSALEVAARQQLEGVAASCPEQLRAHLSTRVLSTSDGIAEAIVEAAEDFRADLIALPAHGKGRFSSVLLGSTTQALLRLSPRPVLVLPRPFTEARG